MKRISIICSLVLVIAVAVAVYFFACRNTDKPNTNKTQTTTAPTTTTTLTTTSTTPTSKSTTTPTPTTPTTPTQTTITTTVTTLPATEPPKPTQTEPPQTQAPKPTPTQPPQTQPPVTQPPVTQPPQTQPPATQPPQKTVFDDTAMQELLAYGQSLDFGYARLISTQDIAYFAMDDNSEVLAISRYDAPEGTLRFGYKTNRAASEITFRTVDLVESIPDAKAVILEFYNEKNT